MLLSFFGDLDLGQVKEAEQAADIPLKVASLLDIAGTKAAVIQKRAEPKDYLDIDAILSQGIDLPTVLAAGKIVYGRRFNPLITLKALSYFDDLPTLPASVKQSLSHAAAAVNADRLPILTAYRNRLESESQR